MRFADLVGTSDAVARAGGRLEKIALLASGLKRAAPEEIEIATAFLSGTPRQGRIGLGGAALHGARDTPPANVTGLELRDVDRAFGDIQAASGPGSTRGKAEILRRLLSRATRDEQDFVMRLIAGDLRQGALEGVLVDAVARAADIPAARVRRAAMLAGALAPVARVALGEGDAALSRFLLQPFQPLQPMLADAAADIDDAMTTLGEAAVEYKMDGARIQVHKVDDEVRVFSRNLREVTIAVPEVVTLARAMPAREAILDGEAIALGPDGAPPTIPGDHAALRTEARCRAPSPGIADHAFLLRRAVSRRRFAGRRAVCAARGASRRASSGPEHRSARRDRESRGGGGVCPPGRCRGPRRGDGKGAGRACMRPAGEAAHGSR